MSTSSLDLRRPRRVLADFVSGSVVRDFALVVGAAVFVGALAQITIKLSFTPVLVTGQTLGVLVAGCALGARRALVAMSLYVGIGFLGVPWFNAHTAGWQGASTGYLFGFVIAGGLCGALAERGGDRRLLRAVAVMCLGEVAVFGLGLLWLALDLHVGPAKALALGLTPFIAGEAIKVAIAAGVLPGAWWLTGRREGEPVSS